MDFTRSQVRGEIFYNCPQFACCAQWNILKFARFVPFVGLILQNWANFDIILFKVSKLLYFCSFTTTQFFFPF